MNASLFPHACPPQAERRPRRHRGAGRRRPGRDRRPACGRRRPHPAHRLLRQHRDRLPLCGQSRQLQRHASTLGDAAAGNTTCRSRPAGASCRRSPPRPARSRNTSSRSTCGSPKDSRPARAAPAPRGWTSRFAGTAPGCLRLTVAAATNPLVAYLAGDSTVCDQPAAPVHRLGPDPAHRSAAPARSSPTTATRGRARPASCANSALFPTMTPLIGRNDLVFIQFGHNDKTTTAAAYRQPHLAWSPRSRAKGGVPVLVTPPVRRLFSGTQLTATALHVNGARRQPAGRDASAGAGSACR